ncbi:alpha/beta hydrolase [Nocardia sp. NPDC088792]|uniref:alpha/beta hydrolase n=1 Tax=Nocardia sp. NPDC088792 TaxID=3364332 RepID=UPI003821FE70
MEIGLARLIDEELADHVAESRRFNAGAVAVRGPASLAELRVARERHAARVRQPGGRAVERIVEAAGRRVAVRVTVPRGDEIRGVYLDIPGGGFYIGSAVAGDGRNAQLADGLGVVVVSVDYRLAPENPWPAAPDDCETAALWLVEHGEELFGTAVLAVGGFSAGSNLAMATLLRMRDRGLAGRFSGAVLQFGAYDLSGVSPGGKLYNDEFFIEAYVGNVADRTDPDISPLFGDVGGLPPALVVVGSLDVLLEDNLVLAARLSAAGNEVDVRVYPESGHGFTNGPSAMAAAALRGIESWLGERVFGGGALGGVGEESAEGEGYGGGAVEGVAEFPGMAVEEVPGGGSQ